MFRFIRTFEPTFLVACLKICSRFFSSLPTLGEHRRAGHRMVTKLGPLCKVKLLKDKEDTLVVRSPEKAGVGGSTPSLATMFSTS